MLSWENLRVRHSNHMITCSRCRRRRYEAAIIEIYAVFGRGHWLLCRNCCSDFELFIRNGGLLMNVQELIDVYAVPEDVDIAEHHALCQCIDCRIFEASYEVDADEIVKGWKEDDYVFSDEVASKSA